MKTAVEWLLEELVKGDFDYQQNAIKKAKEMEKQQIIISFNKGLSNWDNPNHYLGKDYYNENFKNN